MFAVRTGVCYTSNTSRPTERSFMGQVSPKRTKLFIRPITSRHNRRPEPMIFERKTKGGRIIYYFLALALTIASTFRYVSQSVTAENSNCKDVSFIFARGSGQKVKTGPDYLAFKSAVENKIADLNITYDFYDLGSRVIDGHQYPAVSIENPLTATGAIVSAGDANRFGDSVKAGRAELISYVSNIASACPETKFVFGGFSQGGMVISSAIKGINPNKIIYAATFGDPKLYLPEGKSSLFQTPDACKGQNLSRWRVDVPDCKVYEGVLGAMNPYELPGFEEKLGSWCNDADFMCGSRFDLSHGLSMDENGILKAHLSYKNGGYPKAAEIIAQKIKATLSKPTDSNQEQLGLTPEYEAEPLGNDVIVLKTFNTGPNQYLFNEQLYSLSRAVITAGGSIGLYSLGYSTNEHKQAFEVCDFSSSLEYIAKYNERENRIQEDYTVTKEAIFPNTEQLISNIEGINPKVKTVFVMSEQAPDSTRQKETAAILRKHGIYFYYYSPVNQYSKLKDFFSSVDGDVLYPGIASVDQISNIVVSHNKVKRDAALASTNANTTITIPLTSPYTYIVINDAPYGFTNQKTLTITDVDAPLDIKLVNIDEQGNIISKNEQNITPDSFVPLAPNTGARST